MEINCGMCKTYIEKNCDMEICRFRELKEVEIKKLNNQLWDLAYWTEQFRNSNNADKKKIWEKVIQDAKVGLIGSQCDREKLLKLLEVIK